MYWECKSLIIVSNTTHVFAIFVFLPKNSYYIQQSDSQIHLHYSIYNNWPISSLTRLRLLIMRVLVKKTTYTIQEQTWNDDDRGFISWVTWFRWQRQYTCTIFSFIFCSQFRFQCFIIVTHDVYTIVIRRNV